MLNILTNSRDKSQSEKLKGMSNQNQMLFLGHQKQEQQKCNTLGNKSLSSQSISINTPTQYQIQHHNMMKGGQQNQDKSIFLNQLNQSQASSIQYQSNDINRITSTQLIEIINKQGYTILNSPQHTHQTNYQTYLNYQQSKQLEVTPIRMNELGLKHHQHQIPNIQPLTQSQQNHQLKDHNINQVKSNQTNLQNTINQFNGSLAKKIKDQIQNGSKITPKHSQSHSFSSPADNIKVITRNQNKYNRQQNQENVNIYKSSQNTQFNQTEFLSPKNNEIKLLNKNNLEQTNVILSQSNSQSMIKNNKQQIVLLGENKFQSQSTSSTQSRQNCHKQIIAQNIGVNLSESQQNNVSCGVRLLSQENQKMLQEHPNQNQKLSQYRNQYSNQSISPIRQLNSPLNLTRSTSSQQISDQKFPQRRSSQQLQPTQPISHMQIEKVNQQKLNQFLQQPSLNAQKNPSMDSSQFSNPSQTFFKTNDIRSQSLSLSRNLMTSLATNNLLHQNSSSIVNKQNTLPEQQKMIPSQIIKNDKNFQQLFSNEQQIQFQNKIQQQFQSQNIMTQQLIKQKSLPEQQNIFSTQNSRYDFYSPQIQQQSLQLNNQNLIKYNSQIDIKQQQGQSKQLSRSSSTYSQGVVTKNIDAFSNSSTSQYDKGSFYQNFVEKNSIYNNQQQQAKVNQFHFSQLQHDMTAYPQNGQLTNGSGSIYQYRQLNQFEKQIQQKTFDQDFQLNQLFQQSQKFPINQIIGGPQFKHINQGNRFNEFNPVFGQNLSNGGFLNQSKSLDTKKDNLSQNINNFQNISKNSYNHSLIQPLQQQEYNIPNQTNYGLINYPQIQTLKSPTYNQEVQNIDTLTYLNKNRENLGGFIKEQNQIYPTQKSPHQNVKIFEKENYDSPINIIGFQKNEADQNNCNQNLIQTVEFNEQKSPSNQVQFQAEQNIWNNFTPEVKKALVQINFNQHCEEMMNQIAQEKEHRLKSQENTPRCINKENNSLEQQINSFNNQENNIYEINNDKFLQQDQLIKKINLKVNSIPYQQQYFTTQDNNYQNFKIYNQIEHKDLLEEPVKRAQFSPSNYQNNVYSVLGKQEQNEFLKIQDLLKQQQQDRLKIDIYKREDNQDLSYVKDAQFTFSSAKKNIQFDKIRIESNIQNDQKYLENEYDKVKKSPLQNFNQRFEQNSDNQKNEYKQISGLVMCERIIDTDGDTSCEKRQNALDSCDTKRFINLHQVKYEDGVGSGQYKTQRDTNSNQGESFQMQSLILKKYSKFDSPDKMFEKFNPSNQQIDHFSSQQDSSSSKIINPILKVSSPENISSQYQQNHQKLDIQNKQSQNVNSSQNQSKEKLDSSTKINNYTEQKNINVSNLNIEFLEKEVEQIQQIMSPGQLLTPKILTDVNFILLINQQNVHLIQQNQHQQNNFECLQENKLFMLQQNIQRNVEKILHNVKESEINVFGLLRDKYYTEASSSQYSDNSSQKAQSQNIISTFRQSFSNQQSNQISKSLHDSKQLDAIYKKTTIPHDNLKIKQMKHEQKEINASPNLVYNLGKDDLTTSTKILKRSSNKFFNDEYDNFNSNQQKSQTSSNEEKGLQKTYENIHTVNSKDNNTFMFTSNHDQEEGSYKSRRQSYEFKQLLMTQEFEEDEQCSEKQRYQVIQDKKWHDDVEDVFIDPKMFERQKKHEIDDQDIYNIKQDFQSLNLEETVPSTTQNLQKYGLSPIREIESTFDQIQQSNHVRNTNQDYQTTSPDEKRVSQKGNFDTQKSRCNFYTQRGIEEEGAQQEREQNQLSNQQTNPDEKTLIRSINNSQHSSHSLQSQLRQSLTKQQIQKKIEMKKLELKEWEEKQKNLESLEKQELGQRFVNEQSRRENIEKKRQQYYESGKSKSYIFIPRTQLESRFSESQIQISLSPNHQNSLQTSFAHSRQQSMQQIPKQSQCSIDGWDKLSQQSKELNKKNIFAHSINNLHSRKGSLHNLTGFTSPQSAQNTYRTLGQQQNQKKEQQKKNQVPIKNVAQEYLKKCQSKQRSQEAQQLQRIKSTLIANLKKVNNSNNNNNNNNNNKIIDSQLLRSKSNDNIVIKDFLKQKRS